MLAEQGVAPASLSNVDKAPGRLGQPSVPTMGDCLQWLDVAMERGRRKLSGTCGGLSPQSSPGRTVPSSRDATCGAPGGVRADRKARGTSAEVHLLRSAFRRSAPSLT